MFEYVLGHLDFIWNYLLPFLVVLSVLVFVHEWGHYQVARWCGVKVDVFSIGFGPEIFGWNDRRGTRWKFSLIPLGGYVKMLGDMDASSARSTLEGIAPELRDQAFPAKSVGQRAAIVFAGPAVNFIFAILILGGIYNIWGQPYTEAVIGSIAENSAAAEAKLRVGDKILEIDGAPIYRFEDVQRIIQVGAGQPVELKIQRAEEILAVPITPKIVAAEDRFGNQHRLPRLGVMSTQTAYEQHGFFASFYYAGKETYDLSLATLKAVGQIIVGVRSVQELGGPLRIAQLSGQAASIDYVALLGLIALLSINLGLINLFPVPLLDGGHLVFYAIEAVRGKPPNEQIMNAAAAIGVMAVGSLMVLAVYNDLAYFKFFDFVAKLFG
jgi:regulator of sigma E protease